MFLNKGTDGVRIIVPMGDLVTPIELYERAEAATTQEELTAIHEEARAFESWSEAEFEKRWRAMALEAKINPEDSMRANSGGIPKDWIPEHGGILSSRSMQSRYLMPGVKRYPLLIMPTVPLSRNHGATSSKGGGSVVHSGSQSSNHGNSHSSRHSEAYSHASRRSAMTHRRSGTDPYASRRSASGY